MIAAIGSGFMGSGGTTAPDSVGAAPLSSLAAPTRSFPGRGETVVPGKPLGGRTFSIAESGVGRTPRINCPHAHKAVRFYSRRLNEHRAKTGAPKVPTHRGSKCPRYLSHVLQRKARAWRLYVERWLEKQRRRLENPTAAICHVFGSYCSQALRVASCESGRGVYAQNGQYLGMFQMGSYARSRYGHGYTPLEQARAAYAYFVDSGRDWSPWSCKPW